jgi:hypothetical protein
MSATWFDHAIASVAPRMAARRVMARQAFETLTRGYDGAARGRRTEGWRAPGSSAARLYYENAHTQRSAEPTTLPLGVAGFGGDFYGIRRFAERDHTNIVSWNTYEHGGHFAAHKVPAMYASDVQAFFRAIGR